MARLWVKKQPAEPTAEDFYEAVPAASTPIYREPIAVSDDSRAAVMIYTALAIVEVLLGFRLLLRLLSANPFNGFVNVVYTLSYPLISPFTSATNLPIDNMGARFEVATALAMLVYASLAYLAVLIIRAITNRSV